MVCRFIERRRQSFFLTNKIGAPKVRHSIGCSRTYSRSKIARRPYNTSLTSSRLSLSKSERSHKSSIRQFLFQPSNEVPVGLQHSLVRVCSLVTSWFFNSLLASSSFCPSILFSALFFTIMRGMPPVRILTGQPSLANNPFVANTGNAPSL